jgi:PAS domain S-box-containing protein
LIGKIEGAFLEALLEVLPIGFTLVDENDRIIGWNQHETRIFQRPVEIIGGDVRECHPPKSRPLVDRILTEMKADTRDKARFWFDTTDAASGARKKILVEYLALRDPSGKYLGCAGTSQDITEIQGLNGENRLI